MPQRQLGHQWSGCGVRIRLWSGLPPTPHDRHRPVASSAFGSTDVLWPCPSPNIGGAIVRTLSGRACIQVNGHFAGCITAGPSRVLLKEGGGSKGGGWVGLWGGPPHPRRP